MYYIVFTMEESKLQVEVGKMAGGRLTFHYTKEDCSSVKRNSKIG